MERITIIPESRAHWLELRAPNINSTEMPALFGCSPYFTEFELFHRKKKNLSDDVESNSRMRWGQRLQDAIGHGIAHDYDWKIRAMPEYIYLKNLGIGSSFDFLIESPGPAVLETKNVDFIQFKQGWIVDDQDQVEAPLHIEIQGQTQMLVSGIPDLYLGALVAGNEPKVMHRRPNEPLVGEMIARAERFQKRLRDNEAPPINFMEDADAITELYQKVQKDTEMQANDMIRLVAARHREALEAEKEAAARKDAAKAELLTLIGTCERVVDRAFSISAGTVNKKEYTVKASSYRQVRLSWKG